MKNLRIKIMAVFISFLIFKNVDAQNTYPIAGPVGVSIVPFAPVQFIDVNGGNININTPSNSFMLNSLPVLWHNGFTNDIFVGVGAGNNFMTGHNNTFVGNAAGVVNTGADNTFLGFKAGTANTTGLENVIIGSYAGFSQTTAQWNTFVGYSAGQYYTGTGQTENTFCPLLVLARPCVVGHQQA